MADLKEYTITVQKMADELVKYDGGDFVVRNVFDDKDKKYGIPKLKKEGGMTVAYEQSLKVQVGDRITVAVDEKQKKNKDGKEYTVRTIRSIKGDEHGVPYVAQSAPQSSSTGQIPPIAPSLEERVSDLERKMELIVDKVLNKAPETPF